MALVITKVPVELLFGGTNTPFTEQHMSGTVIKVSDLGSCSRDCTRKVFLKVMSDLRKVKTVNRNIRSAIDNKSYLRDVRTIYLDRSYPCLNHVCVNVLNQPLIING